MLAVTLTLSNSGNWSYGKQHGHGIYKYADGTVYEGDFKFGKMVAPDDARKPGESLFRFLISLFRRRTCGFNSSLFKSLTVCFEHCQS